MSSLPTVPSAGPLEGAELTPELARKRKGQLRLIGERFLRNRVSVLGLAILLIFALLAIFAPLLTHASKAYDPPTFTDPYHILGQPTAQHIFGTDDVGRDELARLLYGGRVSLLVGLFVALLSTSIGLVIGAVAGYFGGWIDNVFMRITDAVLAVPLLLILFVLSSVFNDGTVLGVVLLISALAWAGTARLVRGSYLEAKEREYVLAARTIGAGNLRMMFLHILPNIAGPIIVITTLTVGDAILIESVLSFFGFGIQPPTATWGSLLNDSQSYFDFRPLLLYLPGLAILLTVLGVNLMGDGLRDALDPYMTQR
jgi:peptide/nickel transport system permease protein